LTHEKRLHERADEVARAIAIEQEELRLELLRRMRDAADSASLKDLSVAFGILSDKSFRAGALRTAPVADDDDPLRRLTDEQLERELEALEAPLGP
jgi:hypothetical protein